MVSHHDGAAKSGPNTEGPEVVPRDELAVHDRCGPVTAEINAALRCESCYAGKQVMLRLGNFEERERERAAGLPRFVFVAVAMGAVPMERWLFVRAPL